MNGIQRIIDRIEADAAAERAQIAAEAEARCAEIEAAYAQTAQVEYLKIIADGKLAAKQQLERLSGAQATEAKKQVLAVKQEMVLKAFNHAAQLLSELPDEQYIPFLARLSSQASRTGAEMLVFSASDAARIGEAVKDEANTLLCREGKPAQMTVSAETRPIRGGVIILNGDIETNCSIEALIANLRNALSIEVVEKLFN